MIERFSWLVLGILSTLQLAAGTDPVPPPTPAVTIDLGAPVVVEQGKKCILSAKTSAKKVTWKVPTGCDAEVLDGKRVAVWALPGSYTFTAMVPAGDDVVVAEIVLTVTGPRPPPPPVDALTKAVQDAYTADPSPSKAADKESMRAVFTVLAGNMNAAEIKTAKNLFDFNKATMAARIDGRLGGVGSLFATDFGTIVPPNTRESYLLTQTDRDAAKAKLLAYAQILSGVK